MWYWEFVGTLVVNLTGTLAGTLNRRSGGFTIRFIAESCFWLFRWVPW